MFSGGHDIQNPDKANDQLQQLEMEFGDQAIVKSNDFINGDFKFSVIQHRIILAICAQVKKDDPPGKKYGVAINLLTRGRSRNARHIEKKALELQRKVVKLPVSKDSAKKGGFHNINVLSETIYDPVTSPGLIYFSFSEGMKPYFLSLRGNYTKYLFKYSWFFENQHSFKLYEMLKSFEVLKKKEREFSHLDLKQKLGIHDKYVRKNDGSHNYTLFKKKVLDPCREEINEFSDIHIEFERVPAKGTINKIIFTIQPKNRDHIPQEVPGINIKTIQSLKDAYDPELVDYAVDMVLAKTDIRKPGAYVTKALKEGYYTDEFLNQKRIAQQKEVNKANKKKERNETARLEQIQKEYGQFWHKRCVEYFDQHQDKLEEFVEAYQLQYKHDPKTRKVLADFQEQNFNDQVKLKLGNFILQQVGKPEEKDIKAYAKVRYNLEFN
jgi:plasmid replication initiation protein